MHQLKLKFYPDSFLLKPSKTIKIVKPSHIQTAVKMHELMKAYNGLGLSSPQVGIEHAIVVMNTLTYDNGVKRTLYNPVIIEKSSDVFPFREGCLSFPRDFVETNRSNECTVEYINSQNEKIRETFKGVSSVCIQHEIDHINGKLFKS